MLTFRMGKNFIKNISISTRLYRAFRWFDRRIRPDQMTALHNDMELYQSLIPSGALCFDIGANIGEKSEALLDINSNVVSFEPNPVVLPELEARCSHYNKWVLVKAALGSDAAILPLHAAEQHGQSSLDKEWAKWGANVIATYNVPVVTLDSAIQCFGKPYYCKIDVEGWELEVLNGLTCPIPLISIEFLLEKRDVEKTIACLEVLVQFGVSHVNITPAESSKFHFDEWIPLAEFIEWFPGDLKQSLQGNVYGNIYIRNDSN